MHGRSGGKNPRLLKIMQNIVEKLHFQGKQGFQIFFVRVKHGGPLADTLNKPITLTLPLFMSLIVTLFMSLIVRISHCNKILWRKIIFFFNSKRRIWLKVIFTVFEKLKFSISIWKISWRWRQHTNYCKCHISYPSLNMVLLWQSVSFYLGFWTSQYFYWTSFSYFSDILGER